MQRPILHLLRPPLAIGQICQTAWSRSGNLHVCEEGEFVRKRPHIQSEPYGLSYRTVAAIAADQTFRRERLAGGETDCNPLLDKVKIARKIRGKCKFFSRTAE